METTILMNRKVPVTVNDMTGEEIAELLNEIIHAKNCPVTLVADVIKKGWNPYGVQHLIEYLDKEKP